MGRAARKRRMNRARFLAGLYVSDPERFRREWQKRLASWSEEIEKRAATLDGERAYQVIETAREALSNCNRVLNVTQVETLLGVLEHEAAAAVAGQFDRRMYHLIPRCEKR
jgi:hypothetical protein